MKQYSATKVLLFSFFMSISFYTPIFASFFQTTRGFTGTQITILFACFSLTTFLFEIPTGLLGDRAGDKISLIIGSILTTISTLLFIIGDAVLVYIGEIIFAIGGTFFSGPFDALLYKYCCQSNNEDYYEKLVSKSYSLQWIALCFSFVGCYILTTYGSLICPFYATLGVNFVLVFAAAILPKTERTSEIRSKSILEHSIADIINGKELRCVCIANMIAMSLLVCGYQILQTYLADSNVPSTFNGLLYFLAALMASGGSYSFEKIKTLYNSKENLFLACAALITISFLGLSIASSVLGIFLFVCLYRLAWGIISPMFAYLVNKSIQSDECRDTVFSIISLMSNLINSLILFVFGIVQVNTRMEYLVLTTITLLFCIVLKLNLHTKKSNG